VLVPGTLLLSLPRLLGDLDGEQRIQLGACLDGELLHDGGAELFIKPMHCGMDETTDAIGRRWIDKLLLTTGREGGDECFLLPLLCHHLLAKPFDHRLLIGERGLVNTEKRADGGAMCLDHAPFPVVGNNLLRDDA